MTEYTVEQVCEKGATVFFVMRNGNEAVSRHASAETAWHSAEAKARGEAQRTGGKAVYTTATITAPDDPGPRAAWTVQS